jgi:MFS family permease
VVNKGPVVVRELRYRSMTRRALIALGVGQCINWGVLYYSFAVLVLPLQQELGRPTWVVTGAFSSALLMSALMAPRVGRWCDTGRGPVVMHGGGVAAALLLAVWTLVPGVATLYVVWTALGLCMAAALYEPAFVIVGRSYDDPRRRLRALAAVTLFGGLASTVFLPLTAVLVSTFGWRGAVLILSTVLLASATITRRAVSEPRGQPSGTSASGPGGGLASIADGRARSEPPRLLFIASLFALATLASAGFTANLVPVLGERGITPANAAFLGGLIGVMQLPGRALLMNGTLSGAPSRLLTLSLALYACGLLGVAFASSTAFAGVGTAVFALGAGLTTLVRPYLVQGMTADGGGGYLNGRIARKQQLARAAGPMVVAWAAGRASYSVVFVALAGVFAVCGITWQALNRERVVNTEEPLQ